MNKEKILKKVCNEHLKAAFRFGRSIKTEKVEEAILKRPGVFLRPLTLSLKKAGILPLRDIPGMEVHSKRGRKPGKKVELEDLKDLRKKVRRIKTRKHKFYKMIKRR